MCVHESERGALTIKVINSLKIRGSNWRKSLFPPPSISFFFMCGRWIKKNFVSETRLPSTLSLSFVRLTVLSKQMLCPFKEVFNYLSTTVPLLPFITTSQGVLFKDDVYMDLNFHCLYPSPRFSKDFFKIHYEKTYRNSTRSLGLLRNGTPYVLSVSFICNGKKDIMYLKDCSYSLNHKFTLQLSCT